MCCMVVRNRFRGSYSLMKIAFEPIWRAGIIDEFDVTMALNNIRVTSQINCGDVTILSQKRLFLTPMAKPAIDNCCNGFVCSGHLIPCKKFNNTFFTVTSDFGVTQNAICQLY